MAFQRKKPAAIGAKAPYPGFVELALASSVDKVPSGERWIHEIKFDGYRVQVHLRDAAVKVFTRRGNDWSNRFRNIAADAWHINAARSFYEMPRSVIKSSTCAISVRPLSTGTTVR